jgi:hypothetical protein
LSDDGTSRNLSDGFSRVWTSVVKIELKNSTDGSAVLFDNPLGETVDLKVLNNGSVAQFVNLARRSVAFGTYNSLEVTFGRDLMVFPFGSQNGEEAVYASGFNSGTDFSKVTVNLTTPVTVNATNPNVTVQFRLRGWTRTGNQVTPEIGLGTDSNFNSGTLHREWEYEGTISNLAGTAPNRTFTLTDADGSQFSVATSSTTKIFREDGVAGGTLANDIKVKARGAFNPTTSTTVAASIEIDDNVADNHNTEVGGQPLSPDEVTGKFTLVIEEWESELGFPSQDAVEIQTTGTTKYQNAQGQIIDKATAFQLLVGAGADAFVKVKGNYDRANNRVTATEVEFESDSGLGDDAFAIGTVKAVNRNAKEFTITIQQASGFQFTVGDDLVIKTDANTDFADIFGSPLSETAYYNALQSGIGVASVFAEGEIENGKLKARYADLDTGG